MSMQSPVSTDRSWYKKKRWVIPLGLLGIGMVMSPFTDDADQLAAANTSIETVEVTTAVTAFTTVTVSPTRDVDASARPLVGAKSKSKTETPSTEKASSVKRSSQTKAPPVEPEPHPLTVTPGAYCKDAQAGDVGVSASGHSYRCSYYASSDRYRWKRI